MANFGQYPGIPVQVVAKLSDIFGSRMIGTDEQFKITYSRAWGHQLGH